MFVRFVSVHVKNMIWYLLYVCNTENQKFIVFINLV